MKENHELTGAQESYRRGNTSYHAKRTLTAKAISAAIKQHPGITKQEILDTIGETSGFGGFEVLKKHKLAYHSGSPAKWYPTNINPRA